MKRRASGGPPLLPRTCPEVQASRPFLLTLALALTVAAFGGCGHGAMHGAPESADAPGAAVDGVEVMLALRPPDRGGALDVTYTIGLGGAPLPETVELSFPDTWGGRSGFFDDINAIAARDGDGNTLTLEVRQPGRVGVLTDGAVEVTLSYQVAPARRRLHEAGRFRALLTPSTFYAPGHAVFAQPLSIGRTALNNIRVTADPDSTWPVHATWPLDGEPTSIERIIDGAVFGGGYDQIVAGDDRRRIDLWIAPGACAEPERLAQIVQAVIAAQADLLGPAIASRTTVVVLRRDDDPNRLTGNGRAGGFVLELGASVEADDDALVALIAHENLHRLVGHLLRFAASDEYGTLWFREGVTEYVAVRTAVRAGVVPDTRLFALIGDAITNYRANPAATSVDAASIGARYWSDRDLRRLPYDKGALLAMLIDLRLQQAGAGDLSGFLAFLRDDTASRAAPLTNAAVRDALARYSGLAWDEFWQQYVLGSGWLPVFETLADTGIVVVERLVPAPWYGLRTNVTASGEWYVSEVAPGSPADDAGLIPGQALAWEPIVPDDRSGRPMEVVVLSGGREVPLRITPATGQRRGFVLIEDADPVTDYREAFGL